jgi:hypothetical protein
MRIHEFITEAPIRSWTVDDDLDGNEAEMMSRFHGYNREMRHFSQKEKRIIRDEQYVQHIRNVFVRCPVDLSFYFWQSKNPNYDLTAFHGAVDQQWLVKRLGEKAAANIAAQASSDIVTIVMTNNLSDENKISLGSPWIIAHRMAHGLFGDRPSGEESWRIREAFNHFLKKIIRVAYSIQWPDENTSFGNIMADDYREIYGKLLGHTLGTMKSAREGKLTSYNEWWFETFSQFIITGRVTFKALPDRFDDGMTMTKDPRAKNQILRAWAKFPSMIERSFVRLLEESRGKTFVI